MALKTFVKAGNITNLSDARYCAGMGVEIIGFPVGKSNPKALEYAKIKEIAGWVSGIKIALEFEDLFFDEAYSIQLIHEIKPDYIQLPYNLRADFRRITSIPLLLYTTTLNDESLAKEDIILYDGTISDNEKSLLDFCTKNKVILSGSQINPNYLQKILTILKPFGIELKGGNEISPGLKSFDELSEILEFLEVEE